MNNPLGSLTVRARLSNATEWQLSQHLVNVEKWTEEITELNSPQNLIATGSNSWQGSRTERYKEFARAATIAGTMHYDTARWNDAISALEHAYSCYLKIGADTECTRGVIDTARRLARVHLRAGRLNDAAFWLLRAEWIFRERSETRVNGRQLRYRLHDRHLETQISQVQTQLELTKEILRVDEDSSDDAADRLQSFLMRPYETGMGRMSRQSRVEEAEQAVKLVANIGERRLLPEAQMHAVRLRMLAGAPLDSSPLQVLRDWFASDNLAYQSDLLELQLETFTIPVTGTLFSASDEEALSLMGEFPEEARDALVLKLQHRELYTQRFYEVSRHMWDKHRNRYWYTRGLCACYIVAKAAAHPQKWIDGLRSELESAAASINRPDWIDKTYSFDETNGGFWLLGY